MALKDIANDCLLILPIAILISIVCLSGCNQKMISQDQLIGIWQTSDFNEDLGLDLTAGQGVELYFTDDFNVYVRFLYETTAGVTVYSFQYKYEIAGDKFKLNFVETTSGMKDIPNFNIKVKNDKIVLNVEGSGKEFAIETASYVLNKKSKDVPYGYTDADKREIWDKNEKIKQNIRACAQKYSEALNLAVLETGEYSYYSGGYYLGGVEHGITFKIENIDICITLSTLAAESLGDVYILADAGACAMSVAIPCVVSGDFALVYDQNNEPLEEWLNTFMMLYP